MEKIKDYISGIEIMGTKEELDSVQPLSKELVEHLGYLPSHIATRPQYRVKSRPSDNSKGFPVDIALFKDKNHTEKNLVAIFECKNKNIKKGVSQLKNYLDLSNAEFGVWDNGQDRKIFKKEIKNGKIIYREIPSFPKFGDDWKNVGKYKKNELIRASDLKQKFKSIRNYLAANNIGATRDETIAQQIICIIFTKLYDEKETGAEEFLNFSYNINETEKNVADKIKKLWSDVKKDSKDMFGETDKITLDNESIAFVVKELQQYSFMNSDRHVMSEAFETFIGKSLKGEQGQFFTPRNVIELAIKIIDPNIHSKIIDPACGTGGFLIEATKHVWNKILTKGHKNDWIDPFIVSEQKKYAVENIFGIDKDDFLAKVTKSYMMLIGDGKSGIFNADSLNMKNWKNKSMQESIQYGLFDCVFANPPFGSKLKISKKEILEEFEIIQKPIKSTAPQILFIEHCLKLLKNGGKLAIVLPDSIIGNKTNIFIRDYLKKNAKLRAIISLPLTTFQPHTSTKTSLLIIEKSNSKYGNVFIATPSTCGHNRRGELTNSDEVTEIIDLYKEFIKGEQNEY